MNSKTEISLGVCAAYNYAFLIENIFSRNQLYENWLKKNTRNENENLLEANLSIKRVEKKNKKINALQRNKTIYMRDFEFELVNGCLN